MDIGIEKWMVIGAMVVSFFIVERIFRSDPRAGLPSRLFSNGGLWITASLSSVLAVAPIAAWGANQAIWTRPDNAVLWFLVIDLIILDCFTYWMHRAYHVVPFMWRFHEVHHRDEFLDSTSALRFHFGEVIFSGIARLTIIAVSAIPLTSVIVFETLLLSAAIFHHSNVKLPSTFERVLSRVIVTPSIHWVHHHANRADTDSNYAAVLSCWDLLFGSRSAMQRNQKMKIGVENTEDKGLLTLLLMPFRRQVG